LWQRKALRQLALPQGERAFRPGKTLEGSKMPHHPKPFFRTGRGWYVQIGKQQIKLADAPRNPESETAAWEEYHKLMAAHRAAPQAPHAKAQPSGLTVAEVFDKYLGWCKQHREPRTYDWYHDHIQSFINFAPEAARLPVAELKPFHVVEWVDSHGEEWSNAYRRGAIIAIQRPFNWADELGYIPASPIKKIPKPAPQRREQYVSPAEWDKIKRHYQDGDPFRNLLEFSWESGCRPQESKRIESRHVDLEHHRVVFPQQEAKGKKRIRIIRLTPRAEEIIKRHLKQHPDGVLFRNEDGLPWTAQALSCRFARLKKHLGTKYACYDLRHGFCQDMLESGNDPLTVAELMGHADGRMVSQVYSHMNQADRHLEQALLRRAKHQGISR
jgi:integrase